VNEIDGESGEAFIGWKYDRYSTVVPYDGGLRERVREDIPGWTEKLKNDEFDAAVRNFEQTRFRHMSATDWTASSDSSLPPEQAAAYREYRKALKDIPETQKATFPFEIVWPNAPVFKKNRRGCNVSA